MLRAAISHKLSTPMSTFLQQTHDHTTRNTFTIQNNNYYLQFSYTFINIEGKIVKISKVRTECLVHVSPGDDCLRKAQAIIIIGGFTQILAEGQPPDPHIH